jgi:general secretion pathway protein G
MINFRGRVKFLTVLRRPFQFIYHSSALLKYVAKERIVEGGGGFTLVELMVVIGLIAILSGIAIPSYQNHIHQARCMRAIVDIRTLDKGIQSYEIDKGELPDNLGDIGYGALTDPWGNPYQYLSVNNIQGKGKMRKDRFLVPLNEDFDLYSMGKDGVSLPPLTAKASRDDIIRANNGMYIGKAYLY